MSHSGVLFPEAGLTGGKGRGEHDENKQLMGYWQVCSLHPQTCFCTACPAAGSLFTVCWLQMGLLTAFGFSLCLCIDVASSM